MQRRLTSSVVPVLTISADAWRSIERETYRSLDGLETGGILLGLDDGRTISVLHAGAAGPNATRGPKTFLRDLEHAERLASSAWAEDRSQWIGEWHTHLDSESIPSDFDLRSYQRHLADPELFLERFIAIVVNLDRTNGAAAVAWLINQECARSLPFQVRASDRPNPNPSRGPK